MYRLTLICRRLERFGVRAVVVSHGRRDYVVYTTRVNEPEKRSSFSSVRECELFLLTFVS